MIPRAKGGIIFRRKNHRAHGIHAPSKKDNIATGAGTGDSSQQPCVPFAGTGTISGPGGVLTYKVPTSASGCGDEGGHLFSVKGVLQVVKATGKLAKAKGSLRFTGVYSRDDGTFSVKLTGTLKK